MAELLERFAEQCHFQSSAIVVKHDGNPIAPFSNIHHQAGYGHLAFGLRVISLPTTGLGCRLGIKIRQFCVDEETRVRANCIERMS